MREVISIHIGQAGVQMSSAIWEQFCSEHSIDANGALKFDSEETNGLETFFCSSSTEKYVPRAVTVDLEPTVVDEIRAGPYRRLFHPNLLISGIEDASSNFARGHFTVGKDIIDNCINQVRKLVHTCDMLHGFMITSSFGGGTGSGFQTLLLERLSIEFAKHIKLSLVVYPSSAMSTSTVEPYNATLTNNFTVDISDLCILFDNASLYTLCANGLSLDHPSYTNLNRVLAHIMSSLTISLRYDSTLNSDLDQIVTNIVPFPKIHFPVLNAAPILSEAKAHHKILSTNEITRMVFDDENRLVTLKTSQGAFLCCSLQFRGNVTPRDVNEAIYEVKKSRTVNFIDWCPTGFKVGLNRHPPLSVSSSGISESNIGLCMLANTTSIIQVFRELRANFNSLYIKRSFVHWFYGEGMEEGEFDESLYSIDYLVDDYNSMNTVNTDDTRPAFIDEQIIDIEVDEKNQGLTTSNPAVENPIQPEVEIVAEKKKSTASVGSHGRLSFKTSEKKVSYGNADDQPGLWDNIDKDDMAHYKSENL